jgi:hypothetical protein
VWNFFTCYVGAQKVLVFGAVSILEFQIMDGQPVSAGSFFTLLLW